MRRIYSFTLIAVGLSAGLLLAQSDSDYQGWMKTVGATNGSLQKNIAAKDGAAASPRRYFVTPVFTGLSNYRVEEDAEALGPTATRSAVAKRMR